MAPPLTCHGRRARALMPVSAGHAQAVTGVHAHAALARRPEPLSNTTKPHSGHPGLLPFNISIRRCEDRDYFPLLSCRIYVPVSRKSPNSAEGRITPREMRENGGKHGRENTGLMFYVPSLGPVSGCWGDGQQQSRWRSETKLTVR